MSKATLVYLKKRPVNSESQGSQPDPQCHNSMGAVAAERKRTAPFTRYADPICLPIQMLHITDTAISRPGIGGVGPWEATRM